MNKLQWYKDIYWSIENISNIEKQRKEWLGLSESEISSFSEDISSLYDDFDFELFLETERNNIGEKLFQKLQTFNNTLNKFIEANLKTEDIEIIQDKSWLEITELAKICLT